MEITVRPDKDWPPTDCISFVVMEEEGIKDALTADRHFEQACFIALIKQQETGWAPATVFATGQSSSPTVFAAQSG